MFSPLRLLWPLLGILIILVIVYWGEFYKTNFAWIFSFTFGFIETKMLAFQCSSCHVSKNDEEIVGVEKKEILNHEKENLAFFFSLDLWIKIRSLCKSVIIYISATSSLSISFFSVFSPSFFLASVILRNFFFLTKCQLLFFLLY